MQRFTKLISVFNPSYGRAHRAATGARYWVHWSYSEEEWQRFDRIDWSRTRRWFYGILILLGVVAPCWWAIIIPPALPLWAQVLEAAPWFFKVWMGFILVMGVIFLVTLIRGEVRAYLSGIARRKQRQDPEASRTLDIGPLDICQSGLCIPLVGANLKLRAVEIDPSDASLLRFRMVRGRNIPTGISIPIPKGQEANAQLLVERFAREVLGQARYG